MEKQGVYQETLESNGKLSLDHGIQFDIRKRTSHVGYHMFLQTRGITTIYGNMNRENDHIPWDVAVQDLGSDMFVCLF